MTHHFKSTKSTAGTIALTNNLYWLKINFGDTSNRHNYLITQEKPCEARYKNLLLIIVIDNTNELDSNEARV